MNPKLEQLDWEVLSAIQRERQAEMRREAQTDHALGGQASAGRTARAFRQLMIGLCVAAPLVLWVARAAEAASGGGGGGFVQRMM